MVALNEVHANLLQPVDTVDVPLVHNRAEYLRRRRQTGRPPAERGVRPKNRPREVQLQEVIEPVEHDPRQILRARGVLPTTLESGFPARVPFPRVIVRDPRDVLLRIPESAEGAPIRLQ